MRAEQSAKVLDLDEFRKRRSARDREVAEVTTRAVAPRAAGFVWLVPVAPIAPVSPVAWGYWLWPHG